MGNDQPKPGDTVRLKTGGPTMKVKWAQFESDEVCCYWFENGVDMERIFKIDDVTKV